MDFNSILNWVLSTSVMASILVYIILLLKGLFGKRLGSKGHYYIWLILMLRLMLPYVPESSVSAFNLLPLTQGGVKILEMNAPAKVQIAANNPVQGDISQGHQVDSSLTVENLSLSKEGETLQAQESSDKNLNILCFVWLGGAIILGIYVMLTNTRFWLDIKRKQPLKNTGINMILDSCRLGMGIRRNIPVIEADCIRTPALFGFLKPRIILPCDITESLGNEELKYIFLHELAHYKRMDIAINYAAGFLKLLHWFNPIIWYGFYKMRQDCEIACDTLALSYIKPDECREYGNTIINLLSKYSKHVHLTGMAGVLENKSQIKRRIRMISLFKKGSYRWTIAAVIVLAVTGVFFLTNASSAKSPDNLNSKPVAADQITETKADRDVNQVETDLYILQIPGDWSKIGQPGNTLIFKKGEKVIGGLEILTYYPGQPISQLFPNHSETVFTKKLEGFGTEALMASLKLSHPAASGDTSIVEQTHIYFIVSEKSTAFDLYVNAGDVDEDTLLSIAKSFKLKGQNSKDAASDGSIKDASGMIISENHVDFNENVKGRIILKAEKASDYVDNNPGAFMGRNIEGTFRLQYVNDNGKEISSIDINKAFNEDRMVFKESFSIAFEDYNGDGFMDFTIGQYASSNGYVYRLFTVGKDGKISELPIENNGDIFCDNSGYSPKFVRVDKTSFIIQYYDNSRGKRCEAAYSWKDNMFKKISEKEI